MRGGNDRVTRGDKIKVWVKGGSGGDNKDGLKTCCHCDERGEENLLSVTPLRKKVVISTNEVRRNLSFRLDGRERFLASLEMT